MHLADGPYPLSAYDGHFGLFDADCCNINVGHAANVLNHLIQQLMQLRFASQSDTHLPVWL